MKKDSKESLRTYVKRFKAEKAKIVRCDDSIACSSFRKGLPSDHPFFEKLIMDENLTLADSYALAEKHVLWDEAKQSCGNKQKNKKAAGAIPQIEMTQRLRHSPSSQFSIGQILRKLKNEPWFELSPPMNE